MTKEKNDGDCKDQYHEKGDKDVSGSVTEAVATESKEQNKGNEGNDSA